MLTVARNLDRAGLNTCAALCSALSQPLPKRRSLLLKEEVISTVFSKKVLPALQLSAYSVPPACVSEVGDLKLEHPNI